MRKILKCLGTRNEYVNDLPCSIALLMHMLNPIPGLCIARVRYVVLHLICKIPPNSYAKPEIIGRRRMTMFIFNPCSRTSAEAGLFGNSLLIMSLLDLLFSVDR